MPTVEVWRIIKGFTNYSVSNCGRIRNNQTGRILKPYFNKTTGYLKIHLFQDGKILRVAVHRLVAIAFVKNNDERKKLVTHLDGNSKNNYAKNLSWVIRIVHRNKWKPGMTNQPITVNLVDKDGSILKTFKSIKEAQKETGIKDSTISKCCKGLIKVTHGLVFRFAFQKQEDKNPLEFNRSIFDI